MSSESSITGLDELRANIQGVTDDMERKGGRFALRKAANVIRDQARANALKVDDPKTPESIAANIETRWNGKVFKRTGDIGFRIGVLNKGKGGDTFYWRFLEFGTEQAKAQPFLRPAATSKEGEAIGEFVAQYGKALSRHLAKAKKAK